MKIKFLIAGMLSIASTTAVFAQKGVLSDAADAYNKYDVMRGNGNPMQMKLALPNLKTAKDLIDKAAANEKTANLPQTLAVKGGVYSSLALMDSVASTSTPLFITADESLKKAKELDTKGEYKKLIDNSYRNLAQYSYNKAIKAYNLHNYSGAYESFNYYRIILPDDTNAMYTTGLSALNAKKYPEAIENYSNLLKTKYSKGKEIYSDLVSIYLMKGDTTGALKTIDDAIAKYPTDSFLTNKKVQLYIQMGKNKELGDQLDKAIANDPKNKSLYYYYGYTLVQEKDYPKAIEKFTKALEIDPDYYDANLGMSYCYVNPAIELFNKANKLPTTKAYQKQYDDMSAQAVASFEKARPFAVKATEVNPKSVDALGVLRNIYLGKKDQTNANLVQKKIDALK